MRQLLPTVVTLAALWAMLTAAAPAKQLDQAVFGGGCFWCLEAAFEQLKGVEDVVSGYAGGQTANPTYATVCAGKTGHAEVVRIRYDARTIRYRDLLKAFFVIHDPTTKNRQGPDVGSQYRSIILTGSAAEATAAREAIASLTRQKAFPKPIVTEVVPLTRFYLAEDEHQDYFARHPDQPYCALVVAPKVEKLRRAFYDRLKR